MLPPLKISRENPERGFPRMQTIILAVHYVQGLPRSAQGGSAHAHGNHVLAGNSL